MKKIIPYGKHYIDEEDIKAVENVLRHKNLTQGDEVQLFEKAVAKYVGAKYAVAISSWTAGLHIANLAIGIKEGDNVITSPITFVATSNSIIYCGAKPIFSDIDINTVNISPKKLEQTIRQNSNVKAIIPVHYGGLPSDMKSISLIAKKNNLAIIEDAAHALGAKYPDGSMVGSCKYSDMTGFSFHPVKSIAAGEGGMITTNNKSLYRKLLRLRSHGINKLDDKIINDQNGFTNKIKNPWYYEMQEIGFNYRITDFQCALGRSQLKKLPLFLSKRKSLAKFYDKHFKSIKNVSTIHNKFRDYSSHHLYVIKINYEKINVTRALLMKKLRDKGINTQVHYIPVVLHPFYVKLGYSSNLIKNSIKFYTECLSIPIYYELENNDQLRIIKMINEIINGNE
jgi:perosamine synthetase